MSTLGPDLLGQANARIYPEVPLSHRSLERQASTIGHALAAIRQRTTGPILKHHNVLCTPLRLLVLKRGFAADPLECELRVADLQDFPVYDALSYVWGDHQNLVIIKCCARPFAIRQNLYSALNHLRSRDEDRILWVDAICIDQQDLQERGEQVSFMGRIYAAARRVLVWLGEPLQEDSTAFDTIITLKERIPERHLRSYARSHSSQISDGEIRSYEVLNVLRFRHLLRFFSRPWFERVWVIQEVARARQAEVICGGRSIHWDDFAKVVLSFNDAFSYLVTNYGTGESLRGVVAVENLLAMNSLRQNNERMSLFAILCIASTFKSTDPSDKLFALLSLGDRSNLGIQPDYTSHYFDVFRRHVIYELTEGHRLHYLARPPIRWRPEWPSWIPDWTEKSRSSYFYTAMNHGFQAAADTQPMLTVSQDESILSISGKVIDSIASLVAPLDRSWVTQLDGSPDGTQSAELLQWLEECMTCVPLELGLVQDYANSALDPFLRTFACTGVHGNPTRGTSARRSRNDTAELRRTLIKVAAAKRSISNLARAQDDVLTPLTALASMLYPAIADRQFFKTTGNRLGWVSRRAQKGDVVCVLYGGDVPFVLRHMEDENWRMIGECYVDGLMQGEAKQMKDGSDYTFHIR
jgi:hypothetical protein